MGITKTEGFTDLHTRVYEHILAGNREVHPIAEIPSGTCQES